MEPVRYEKTLALSSSPAALWPLLSNTDRLNRAMGLPASTASSPDPKDFSQKVRARLAGIPLEWTERAFEYVDERGYEVTREFTSGPFSRFTGGLRLSPKGAGSEAALFCAFWPRWEWARPAIAFFARKSTADLARLYRSIDDSLARAGSFPAPPRTVTPPDAAALEARAKALRATRADPKAVERLVELLRSGADDEVRRMRPFELADSWGLPRTAALGACLHAVKAGLLDLSWEVLCPNCEAPKERLTRLSDLKTTSHCDSCDIDYGVDFDKSVELRVSPHPGVRETHGAVFCAGSPAHTRHAALQAMLDGETARGVDVDLAARSYDARLLQAKRSVRLRPAEDGPTTVSIDFSRMADGAEIPFKPGTVRLAFQPSGAPGLARVEKESWRDAAATAALVTTLQDFRDLFSSEVLAPGVEIGIKNLALVFTDLKGSTALYEKVGDATAYGIVRDHFDFLYAIIAARGGAVVKTIGDAVMAVFPTGASALEAALDMQDKIDELNRKLAPRPPVELKIGVHQGPAIAINAAGVLDYFGTMVNVSARVQNESAGGDVVVTKAIGGDPACAAVLKRREPAGEHFTIPLKGLSGEFDLWRLRVKSPSINK